MKKMMALLVCLCLTFCCVTALAAGKLTVSQETYMPMLRYESYYGYLFAEVTNTGDKNVEFGNGIFEILTADGDPQESNDVYSCYPSVLAPGETGYLFRYDVCKEAASLEDIGDYTLTVSGKATKDEITPRVGATAELVQDTYSWGDPYAKVTIMMSNTNEQDVLGLRGAYGVYDAEGKLIYADNIYNIDGVLLPAGQTVGFQQSVDSAIVEYWAANGMTPATVKAIVYVED